MRHFLLLASLFFVITSPALAADIPGHLSGLTGQLIKAAKNDLSLPTGTSDRQALINKAYKHLKSRSLHRFAGKGVKGDPEKLEKHHEIELENGEKIEMDWDPESGEFTLSVGKKGDGEDAHRTDIKGKTKTSKDKNGNPVTEIDTETVSVTPKNSKDLRQEMESVSGEWIDANGVKWNITSKGITSIELAQQRKGETDYGDIYNGTYWKGRVKATSPNDDVRDFKDELPMPIKKQLLDYSTSSELDLKLAVETDNDETVLKGKLITGFVYYQPDTFKINRIEPRKSVNPFKLTRDFKDSYKIGSLDFNLFSWYTSKSELLAQIQKYKDDLAYLQKYIGEQKTKRDAQKAKKDKLDKQEQTAKQALVDEKAKFEALKYPKGSANLKKRLISLNKSLIREKNLMAALVELNTREPDEKYTTEIADLKPVIKHLKEQTAKREQQLDALRVPNAKKLMKESTDRLLKAQDDLIRIPLQTSSLAFSLEILDARITDLENESTQLEATIAPLEKARKKFEAEGDIIDKKGGLITGVLINANGKEVFVAGREAIPYQKALKKLDDDIAKAQQKKIDARVNMRNAETYFLRESEHARGILARVASSIMTSAYGQSLVEAGFFAEEAVRNFQKGGPLAALGSAIYKRAEWSITGSSAVKGVEEDKIRKQVEQEIRTGIQGQVTDADTYWLDKVGDYKGRVANVAEELEDNAWKASGKRLGKTIAKHSGARDVIEVAALKALGGEWAQSKHAETLQKGLLNYFKKNNINAANWLEGVDDVKFEAIAKANEDLAKIHKRIKGGMFGKAGNVSNNSQTAYRIFKEHGIKALAGSPAFQEAAKSFGKDMGLGLMKDAAKSMAKDLFKNIEMRAWHDYFHQDYIARQSYGLLRETREHYWEATDYLEILIETRRKFVETHDPNSGFGIAKNTPFKKDAKLEVKFYRPNYEEKIGGWEYLDAGQATVTIAETEAKPSGKKYVLDAKSLKSNKFTLPLKVFLKGK